MSPRIPRMDRKQDGYRIECAPPEDTLLEPVQAENLLHDYHDKVKARP